MTNVPMICLLLALATGCGAKEDATGTGDQDERRGAANPSAAASAAQRGGESDTTDEASSTPTAAATAAVKGVVKFFGKAPPRKPIDMTKEAYCAQGQPAAPRDESVIVNGNGTLRNVFVWVKKGVRGRFPPPEKPVVIDQRGCRYVPHVIGMQAKQKLLVRNSDPLLHNIHAIPRYNKDFNVAQTKKGMEHVVVMRKAEVMVPVKCEVHDWMRAYVGVVPHPFFAVTGEDGAFELGKLPPGDYTIEAWQETYGKQTIRVTLAAHQTLEIQFKYPER